MILGKRSFSPNPLLEDSMKNSENRRGVECMVTVLYSCAKMEKRL